jgi:predicted DNA-binding protein
VTATKERATSCTVSNEAHVNVKALKKSTGKTITTIVDELVLEEVALKGRKTLSNKAIEAQNLRKQSQ